MILALLGLRCLYGLSEKILCRQLNINVRNSEGESRLELLIEESSTADGN